MTTATDLPDLATSDDPLADFSLDDLSTDPPATQAPAERPSRISGEAAELIYSSRNGDCLYFDIETVPDDARVKLLNLEPLPEVAAVEEMSACPIPRDFIALTTEKQTAWLKERHPPEDWLQQVEFAERSREKPRETLLKAIASKRGEHDRIAEAVEQRIKQLSTNPLTCRIVALSVAIGLDDPRFMVCHTIDAEREALEAFWQAAAVTAQVVGYNVRGFDVPTILARSVALGVKPTTQFDLRKYGSSNVIDLMLLLFDGIPPKGFNLTTVCRLMSIDVPEDDSDGSQIHKLVAEQKWFDIGHHCNRDVMRVQKLHREKLAGYFCV